MVRGCLVACYLAADPREREDVAEWCGTTFPTHTLLRECCTPSGPPSDERVLVLNTGVVVFFVCLFVLLQEWHNPSESSRPLYLSLSWVWVGVGGCVLFTKVSRDSDLYIVSAIVRNRFGFQLSRRATIKSSVTTRSTNAFVIIISHRNVQPHSYVSKRRVCGTEGGGGGTLVGVLRSSCIGLGSVEEDLSISASPLSRKLTQIHFRTSILSFLSVFFRSSTSAAPLLSPSWAVVLFASLAAVLKAAAVVVVSLASAAVSNL